MLLFSLITLLEMHLLRLIKERYPDDSWQKHLSEGRVEEARDLFRQRRERNEEIDLADCLQLCDKRDLIVKNSELRRELGLKSRTQAEARLKRVEELRNNLMHGQDIASRFGWEQIVDELLYTESLLKRSESILPEGDNPSVEMV